MIGNLSGTGWLSATPFLFHVWGSGMARKPNYGQNRADVNRAKQARKEAKLEALKDAVARRKSGEDPLDDEAGAFSSEAEALGGSENATTVAGAFSGEAESLGGSENAAKEKS